ncbi:nucleotidyltransferase domain-containing protein [bacterium]|nr:nucleotidyltransferase domain-containing protein [Candidatus Atribacteria bacterium]MBU4047706.1 nucleotidyltransferase domain-containing protein [bacterium]MBU4562582.1 nucleotidyltransferase domain-containing protein [bacterium]
MISQEEINEVIDRIVKNINPEKIILFGSYASGNPSEDSDLDILIVKEMRIPRYKRTREVKKHLRGMKIPIDVIVYTKKEIKEWEDTKTAFINQAIKQGKILYG